MESVDKFITSLRAADPLLVGFATLGAIVALSLATKVNKYGQQRTMKFGFVLTASVHPW